MSETKTPARRSWPILWVTGSLIGGLLVAAAVAGAVTLTRPTPTGSPPAADADPPTRDAAGAPPGGTGGDAAAKVTFALDPPRGEWPCWRGPTGDGQATGDLARRIGAERWRAPLDGLGHGSPVVFGGTVYLTSYHPPTKAYRVHALDRQTGKPRWEVTVHEADPPPGHAENSPASATPAADADGVTALFPVDGRFVLTALDVDGKRRWQTDLGPFQMVHGPNGSPIPVGDLLIVQVDNLPGAYVVAVDRRDGSVVWRRPRPEGIEASYSTPLVLRREGRTELFLTGAGKAELLDAASGEVRADLPIDSTVAVTTPVAAGTKVLFSFGYPKGQLRAVDAAKMTPGAPTGSPAEAWAVYKSSHVPYVPSPVVVGDRLIVAQDEGLVSALSIATGEVLWKERFGPAFHASPVAAGGTVLLADKAGQLTVVDVTGEGPKTLAELDLGVTVIASPAVLPEGVLVRAEGALIATGPVSP